MPGIQSLLQSLETSLKQLTSAQTLSSLTDKVSTTWNAQTPATKGTIAGGVLGLLVSGNARRMAGSVAQVGAAALIGRFAMQAYSDWQSEKAGQPGKAGQSGKDAEPIFDDLSHRLLQAMIAAAKADDVVTAQERASLDAQLANLGLGADAEALIRAELDAPLDAETVASLARTPHEAAALYTASLLVIDQRGQAEHTYLQTLATCLGLDAALVRHLEANVPAQG